MGDFTVVFSAEFVRRVKSRPFQIGVLVGVLGIFAIARLPGLLAASVTGAGSRIVLAGNADLTMRAKPILANDFTIVATRASTAPPTMADLEAVKASSWITFGRGPQGGLRFDVYARNPKSGSAETVARDLTSLNISLATSITRARAHDLLQVPYTVKGIGSKFATAADAATAWGAGYAMLLILYVLILVNSQMVMSSVAEEKTSRIAELLVASISTIPLLYGKIAAATAVGLLQMVVWFAAGVVFGGGGSPGSAPTGERLNAGALLGGAITAPELLAFVALFTLGFLQFSMLFAGIGSLINRTEDLGSVSMPIVIPVVGGFLAAIAALGSPDAPWAVALTYVPLISPFVLFARIAMTDVPAWQLVAGLVINLVSAWAIAWIAGKLYRVGMLLYGRPPSLGQIWSVIRS